MPPFTGEPQPHRNPGCRSPVLSRRAGAGDVHQVMVDLMGVTADDLKGSEGAELGMTDLNVGRCRIGGRGPGRCRRPQRNQPDNWREPLVAADLGEGILIPAGDVAARIVGEGEQPFGPDPQDIHQVPHVHRGRPGLASASRRVRDTGDRSRRGLGSLGYQIDSVPTSQLPVEAAFRAARVIWLPPHNGTVSDPFASAVAAVHPGNEVTG